MEEKGKELKRDVKWALEVGYGGFPGGDSGKENPPASAGDVREAGSIPGSGRSPGGGNGTPSSLLAWDIPWMEEPGGSQSAWSQSQTGLK